jgi:hypothetical protein
LPAATEHGQDGKGWELPLQVSDVVGADGHTRTNSRRVGDGQEQAARALDKAYDLIGDKLGVAQRLGFHLRLTQPPCFGLAMKLDAQGRQDGKRHQQVETRYQAHPLTLVPLSPAQ